MEEQEEKWGRLVINVKRGHVFKVGDVEIKIQKSSPTVVRLVIDGPMSARVTRGGDRLQPDLKEVG